jgi:hypothetical protein
MTLHAKHFSAALASVSFVFLIGCDYGLVHPAPPKYKPSVEAAKAMDLFDTNRDGKIAGPELEACPGLKASLKVAGSDAATGLTLQQIAARVQRWKDSRLCHMTPLSCLVTRDGQPLANATVKFTPEEFLADVLTESPTGTTNHLGMAMVAAPANLAVGPGITPGMYRVEITKDGEEIPAKYNTATELGQEVSLDNPDMQKGVRFDLNY